jgi:predicted DCC family thiol-disulfide oxidoreductase YuxK
VRRLTVLYDARCGLCSNARRWLLGQGQLVPLQMVAAGSEEARRLFPTLAALEPAELVVVSDEGDVYRGSNAWIVCLWALESYRDWSFRLARPTLLPLARHAFEWVSTRRHSLSRALRLMSDQELVREVSHTGVCPQGLCTPPSTARAR